MRDYDYEIVSEVPTIARGRKRSGISEAAYNWATDQINLSEATGSTFDLDSGVAEIKGGATRDEIEKYLDRGVRTSLKDAVLQRDANGMPRAIPIDIVAHDNGESP